MANVMATSPKTDHTRISRLLGDGMGGRSNISRLLRCACCDASPSVRRGAIIRHWVLLLAFSESIVANLLTRFFGADSECGSRQQSCFCYFQEWRWQARWKMLTQLTIKATLASPIISIVNWPFRVTAPHSSNLARCTKKVRASQRIAARQSGGISSHQVKVLRKRPSIWAASITMVVAFHRISHEQESGI